MNTKEDTSKLAPGMRVRTATAVLLPLSCDVKFWSLLETYFLPLILSFKTSEYLENFCYHSKIPA